MRSGTDDALLIVFLKAPRPGRVKTRLAIELGEARAADVYRSMAETIVERLRGGRFRLVVYFDPPDEEAQVREWIGGGSETSFLPQPNGDLGARLEYAFDWGLERARAVCVVGTDIPALDRSDVEQAIGALGGDAAVDLVLGPARDGGYYLMGLRAPCPDLFRGIPWSTSGVLDTTLRRARSLGLRTRRLRTLIDVDSPEDLREVASLLEHTIDPDPVA